ncbi:unnamed protein product [Cuscuta epithymum]|uniref:Aminotransferase-like plant mobile domain-containing protein n=1 Tax=Cuscuta epithymum TaxID=186058 RepID=A0AAV0DDN5_9ASTE|nr:unnamed protein product [Cuscuta epithymum]
MLRAKGSPHILRMRWMKVPEKRLDVEIVNKAAIIGPRVRRDHQEMEGGPLGMEVSADPGPSDHSDLTLQATHRSEDVWHGLDVPVDRCREHLRGLSHVQVDDRVLAYVRAAGFYGLHRLVATVPLDKALLTALLERWRQETHTFHLPVSEVIVTLGDVAVLTGLEVDGRAVTGTACRQWVEECERLLGVRPLLQTDIQGSYLRMPWLREHFAELPPDADEVMTQQDARAYILMMTGLPFSLTRAEMRFRCCTCLC